MTAIEGYENYTINESGVVINTNTAKEMIPSICNGYYIISLSKNCKRKYFKLHRLIALTFIPNTENKPFVDHINRNRKDNRIENLRWVSRRENNRNKTCYSNSGLQYIYKLNNTTGEGYKYRFQLRRPEIKKNYTNTDLQPVIEFRNKFCAENDIEINDY